MHAFCQHIMGTLPPSKGPTSGTGMDRGTLAAGHPAPWFYNNKTIIYNPYEPLEEYKEYMDNTYMRCIRSI